MRVLGITETLVMMPTHRRDAQSPVAFQNLFKHALEMRPFIHVGTTGVRGYDGEAIECNQTETWYLLHPQQEWALKRGRYGIEG